MAIHGGDRLCGGAGGPKDCPGQAREREPQEARSGETEEILSKKHLFRFYQNACLKRVCISFIY